MIFADLTGVSLYRAHTPEWAFKPLSGAGAAKGGGRFNRPGIEALYLSFEADTAISEYKQTSHLLPPLTLCQYRATLHRLVDLRLWTPNAHGWNALWMEWDSDWRDCQLNQHIDPPTWALSDLVRDANALGVIFPSMVSRGGTNVVVYLDRLGVDDALSVVDPDGLLPSDNQSWKPR